MKFVLAVLIGVCCAVSVGSWAASEAECEAKPYAGSKEFERMTQLVGVWEGSGMAGKEEQKTKVEYKLTAGGSVVMEYLSPGTPHEMVSAYLDRKGKLSMTHYCMLQNQPRMDLEKAGDDSLAFVFAKENDIDPAKEAHMHALTIEFKDKDHIVQKWTLFKDGKDAGTTTLSLARVR
jgi:hypothetical protein